MPDGELGCPDLIARLGVGRRGDHLRLRDRALPLGDLLGPLVGE
jgi:hypothetical protein